MMRKRLVRVPASSANLGPGFDSFAAALSLHLELEVCESGSFAVSSDLPVSRTRENLCVRAFERLHSADGFSFNIRSQIPLSGGLGSSGAAIVAGLLAADHLFELDADLLELASEIEGHPDNVAASLAGGFVICADQQLTRLQAPAGLEALAIVPEFAGGAGAGAGASGSGTGGAAAQAKGRHVSTKQARAALPAEIPIGDAVFNVAHSALLALGLERGDFELIARGLADRIHQPRRAHLYERSYALLRQAKELGALGATISGAGPTVLVWCHYEQTGSVVQALQELIAGWAQLMRVPFEPQGARVLEI